MKKYVKIGKILSPHGLNGCFKISIAQDYKKLDFEKINLFDEEHNTIKIKILNPFKKNIFISRVNNILTRNESEKLGKKDLYCLYQDLPPLQDDEFFYSDLIGKKLVNEHNQEIGSITNVLNYGAGDIIEVFVNDKKEYFPFSKEIFIKLENNSVEFIYPSYI